LTSLVGWRIRTLLQPLHQSLLAAIQNPIWQDDLSEEYFVFQLLVDTRRVLTSKLLRSHASWLAALVRLESERLSQEEIERALRQRLRDGRLNRVGRYPGCGEAGDS
jgi:hypothetical protein